MAVYKKNRRAYSIGSAFVDVFNPPIVAERAPTVNDKAEIGTLWVDKPNNDVYFLTSITASSSSWINAGGGSGSFDSLTVTNNTSIGGTLTLSALTAGTVRSSAAGLISVLADGNDGEILIGTTGGAAAWSTLTAGAGINIAEAAGTITISNPGVTGTSITCSDANNVTPDGAGITEVIGYDANITTDGATANTVKIRLADNIVSVGSITATADLDMSTGICTITSDNNAADAIYLHADAGVNEKIRIHSGQGTSTDSVKLQSDAGGVTITGGLASSDAINISAIDAAGGITVDYGTGGVTFTGADGGFTVESGTANISIGADAADHDILLGDDSGANALTMYAGTNGVILDSNGAILIDSAGDTDINSSAGDINIANDNVAQNVNIATGAAVKTLTLGNVTGATAVTVNCGTGGANFGTSATAHTTTIGSTNTTSALTLQTGTGAVTVTAGGIVDVDAVDAVTIDSSTSTISIGADDIDQNVNIATDGERLLTLGSSNGAAATTVVTGTGNLDLGVNATAHTTRLGSTNTTCDTTIQSGTGAMTFTAGGIWDVNATGAATIDAPSITVTSSSDAAQAIYLHTNTGTSETIELINTQGTDAAAINLTATAGGIKLDASGKLDKVYATDNAAANSITLNAKNGSATFTGQTTASGAQETFTITNNDITAGCPIHVTVCNLGTNDARMTMEQVKTAAGSMEVKTQNNGGAALNGDVIITWDIGS
jgi:hypothetical protein